MWQINSYFELNQRQAHNLHYGQKKNSSYGDLCLKIQLSPEMFLERTLHNDFLQNYKRIKSILLKGHD